MRERGLGLEWFPTDRMIEGLYVWVDENGPHKFEVQGPPNQSRNALMQLVRWRRGVMLRPTLETGRV